MPRQAAHVEIGVADVERIAALGWRGLDEDHTGDWLLRAAEGFTGRANSALVLGPPPPIDGGWLPALVEWYTERGLPPMVQVPLPGGEAIDAVLDAAGWRSHDLVRFLTGDIAEVQKSTAESLSRPSEGHPVSNLLAQGALHSGASGQAEPGHRIGWGKSAEVVPHLEAEPDDAWLAAYHYRGAPLPKHAREVLLRVSDGTQLCFASLRTAAQDGSAESVLAVARGAVAQGWLGVTAVTVADQHRRRRHGTRLMSELARWAAERGGLSVYLQVASDNVPALRLYERLGFHHHHDYRYRVGPDPAAVSS